MKKLALLLLSVLAFSCSQQDSENASPDFSTEVITSSGLTEAALYDRVLGMLVGSALGDAMGAPTEMWTREAIQLEYGFVEDLDSMVREASQREFGRLICPQAAPRMIPDGKTLR